MYSLKHWCAIFLGLLCLGKVHAQEETKTEKPKVELLFGVRGFPNTNGRLAPYYSGNLTVPDSLPLNPNLAWNVGLAIRVSDESKVLLEVGRKRQLIYFPYVNVKNSETDVSTLYFVRDGLEQVETWKFAVSAQIQPQFLKQVDMFVSVGMGFNRTKLGKDAAILHAPTNRTTSGQSTYWALVAPVLDEPLTDFKPVKFNTTHMGFGKNQRITDKLGLQFQFNVHLPWNLKHAFKSFASGYPTSWTEENLIIEGESIQTEYYDVFSGNIFNKYVPGETYYHWRMRKHQISNELFELKLILTFGL